MIEEASFFKSIADISQYDVADIPEIAVAGKSNVGKSSFINRICRRKKLARVSKSPGHTRLMNFYSINAGEYYLVDLPGYGYASVSDAEKRAWGRLIEAYFDISENLRNVILLLDARRAPGANDMMMLEYLTHRRLPYTAVMTKSDKLSRAELARNRLAVANAFRIGYDNVLTFSSVDGRGASAIYARLDSALGLGGESPSDCE